MATAAGMAAACDTPVYRYAMYRWEPAPYRVFYLYREQPAKADAAVLARLDALANGVPAQTAGTNLRLQQVDVSKTDQLDLLPEDARTRWAGRVRREEPTFLVFTSWGAELYGGKLTAEDVNALLQSPVRTKIAERLEQDHLTVLLVLSGKDAADNKTAQQAVAELSAQVASGKIQLGAAPTDSEDAAGGGEAGSGGKVGSGAASSVKPADATTTAAPKAKPFRIATLALDRSDPAEVWLVRSLTSAEKEYPEYVGRAMVFPVFGRGRVLAPCVDKTLTVDALAKKIDVLAGACSCTVKDQNPGVDLLFTWDWDATADKLSAKDAPLDLDSPAATPATANAGKLASASSEGEAASAPSAAGSVEVAALVQTPAPANPPSVPPAGNAPTVDSGAWIVWGVGLVLGIGVVLGIGLMKRKPAA
jgi:hypothetical protein